MVAVFNSETQKDHGNIESIDNHQHQLVVGDERPPKHFLCIFNDTSASNKASFHANMQGTSTIGELYNYVANTINHQLFVLVYTRDGEDEIYLDKNCDDTLVELLEGTDNGKHKFEIKPKDNGPITVIVDNPKIPQETQDDEDTVSYAGEFFIHQEASLNDNTSSGYTSSFGSSTFYDTSRTTCGYVGLVNQAMTCYLNSLIQTLFMTPEFRNALYKWRYKGDKDKASHSIPLQLQKLFLKLEISKKRAVETKDLTKSFGWDTSEAWQQHDVQELCRVMFDALEETLKETDQHNLINRLYQGKLKDYVKCLECGHESCREDMFLDVSVEIRPYGSSEPHKNLKEALKAFVKPDTLDGNNQYYCEKCECKRDAHKGLKFVLFPYLLTIQLKRFTFDIQTAQRIKLHDRLEFPFKMNLDYLLQECNGDNEYELFSILIHSGSALGGHYYAYIKSFETACWYCFNDQYVSQISEEDLQKAFGGGDKYRTSFYSSSYSSSTSAYMLMYRRIDISKNISKITLSPSLKNLYEKAVQDDEDEYARKEREKNMCKLKLYCYDPKTSQRVEHKFHVYKETSLKDATEAAWKQCDLEEIVPLDRCRLIKYDSYYDSFECSFDNDSMDEAIVNVLGGLKTAYAFDLLLEWLDDDEQFQEYRPGGITLKVFLVKNLDASKTDDFDSFKMYCHSSQTVEELKESLKQRLHIEDDVRVAVLKDSKNFQLLQQPNRTLKIEGLYKTAKIFVEWLDKEDALLEFWSSLLYDKLEAYKNCVNIKCLLQLDDRPHEEINLLIDRKATIQTLREKLERHANLKPYEFRLYRHYAPDRDYECVKLDDSLPIYLDDIKFAVKSGRALRQGESRMKLYFLHINNFLDHTEYFTEVVIHDALSMKQLKEEQIIPTLRKTKNETPIEKIRLRKKSYKSPGLIYVDDVTFEKLNKPVEMFVELLKDEERVLSDDFLSIYVRQWHPSSYVIDQLVEIILFKETTVSSLKAEIGKVFDIPAEFIELAKGHGTFPCNMSLLDVDGQLKWNAHGEKLGERSYSISEDGAVFYFKDKRECLKQLTTEERSKILEQERKKISKISFRGAAKEKALKIYTNAR